MMNFGAMAGLGAPANIPAGAKKALNQWKRESSGNYTFRTRAGALSVGRSYFYRGNEEAALRSHIEFGNRTYFGATGYKVVITGFQDDWKPWPKTSYMWAAIDFVPG